ncbi:interferon-inducible GTPase-domain-containing protein [Diplogelasinospora grovesii]|uniref:Interferon-inducible GTPase-domain-containing protein n=1 Tax=Diplogelasinospora grovesii TaxID=303347 RepID=A0AAN6MX37_9PEZI|nr:interferon-inducible GTPase-domain-containing protein [Diplogelasinospora grovesii]
MRVLFPDLTRGPDLSHVAICGPAGSGKTSIINALRGLRNNDGEAARTGTVEMTTQRTKYPSHSSFNSLILHDCPGAGTLRVPADMYYYTQKLYLFDLLLIIHGERFGEFVIIRSRSDEMIRRISEDEDLDIADARERHIQTTVEALIAELIRAGVPNELVAELMSFCFLINKNDLRVLTTRHTSEWPEPSGQMEIHERWLLTGLGKEGTAA